MKHRLHLYLLLISLAVVFAGCGKKQNQQKQENVATSEQVVSLDRINIEADPIAINSLSEDEIKEMINAYDNLKTREDFYINIPDRAPLLEFVARWPEEEYRDFGEFYKEYLELFEYFFPGHELNKDVLYYYGSDSYKEYAEDDQGMLIPDGKGDFVLKNDYKLVKDSYDNLMSGKSKAHELMYDEGERKSGPYGEYIPYYNYTRFELNGFLGYGLGTINSGKIAEMELESDEFEFIGLYSPSSNESFKLADKEVAINEAVNYFENYINSVPYPEEANLETVVAVVWVYKVNEDAYGYFFSTTARNHGIIYDYEPRSMIVYDGDDDFYQSFAGYAFMMESDDVAFIEDYYRLTFMDDVKQYDNVFPFEEALKTVSDSLTDAVDFTVLRAELVYTLKSFIGDDGYTVIDDGFPRTVLPCWRLVMYNENDDKFYNCYVNALDGEFRYYAFTSNEYSIINTQQEN